ncbi:hypothetical protein [Pseudarthrobacter sp. S9]|uniref:hypothetical protein n=1 Tax=Pseudarthrobacter sp. S9 TaxID=3418421 RepID=UPI003D03BB61
MADIRGYMDDSTTTALNLTFLMTLGMAFLMFLGHLAVFTAILLLAGAGRVLALILTAARVGCRKNSR